ncbi:MAG TPA: AAA family ATPase [Actinomycetes bacterium]|nr:AAA family ATPase [Actinomycetes bacterium]
MTLSLSSPAPALAAGPTPAVLDAVLERVTYANEETGYTVARVASPGSADLITVVGPLLGAQPGERLRLEGRWRSHQLYGRQFEVRSYSTLLPATVQGIRRYLGSGLIKGIGPKMAERIVDHFGADTLRVLEEDPARLHRVPGLGPKRTAMIEHAWQEQKAIKEVMVFLQGVGVSTSLAVRIYRLYRDEAVKVVSKEPYRLAVDVWGIGFKTADKIAQGLGIGYDSPARIKAGLQYTLSEASEAGHCYLPEPELVAKASEILGVRPALVGTCLEELVHERGVIRDSLPIPGFDDGVPAVYLVPFYRAEVSLAAGLLRLLAAPPAADRLPAFHEVDWAVAFDWLGRVTGCQLAPEQAAAVRLALTERVAVLTGGPGCGKSFAVRAIVTLAHAKQAKIVLAAPTGRAAKRLSELAGMPAQTLHRLLELRPGGDAGFDTDRPLDADLVVVDEVSMLDLLLANKLVKAVPSGAHLLLVGDADQLPSVGPGEVLRDLLHSGKRAGAPAGATGGPAGGPAGPAADVIPRVRLTRIFRQAQGSGVVTNAHRINAGQPPVTQGLADFFLFPEDDPERVADLTVDIATNRLPRRFGLDPRRDIQVLCPMHRGPAGAGTLNERLQQALTPGAPGLPERRFAGRTYRAGDKVMQVRNDYDKGVFNGSVGVVTTLSPEEGELRVLLDDDEEVRYGFDELDELTHAYALTVHRSQGSEYPCVVVPLTPNAWLMLQRNLLYTAVSRARQLVVLVGSRRALAKAIRTAGAGHRHTGLDERLRRQSARVEAAVASRATRRASV